MKQPLYISFLLTVIIAYGCTRKVPLQPTLIITTEDSLLKLVNGKWIYKSALFTGTINTIYPNGNVKSEQAIVSGKQQGVSKTFYPSGKPESWRWYDDGEKDSVHTGWWPNGNKKFEYHFSKGQYNGLFTEWYQDEKMIQQILYKNGKDVYGKGWRDNGKVYMNFVTKGNRRYGIINPNLCHTLKSEKVE